jgi:heat shock protein HslJ
MRIPLDRSRRAAPVRFSAAALALALAACAGPSVASTDTSPAAAGDVRSSPALTGTTWVLTELGGQPVQASAASTPRLVISDGRVTGSTGCNSMSGTADIRGDNLRFGPIASTKRACAEGMALEPPYLAALGDTERYSLQGRVLTLLGGRGTLAKFEAR